MTFESVSSNFGPAKDRTHHVKPDSAASRIPTINTEVPAGEGRVAFKYFLVGRPRGQNRR